ncbi:MAG: LON peptidase substrate-binding domain-containing protein, partial [Candidatus Marinimicrobia bacterium]|nr:LON peptidase substrate-binding domain-containing protein [Candidatus Neomarinimicrobiota bacterium]
MNKTIDSYPIETVEMESNNDIPEILKILPIEGNIPFPHIIFPVVVTEARHMQLVREAMAADSIIGIFNRNIDNEDEEDPFDGVKDVGVACHILKIFNSNDESMRILVQGDQRIKLLSIIKEQPYAIANIALLTERHKANLMTEALVRNITELFNQMIASSPIIPEEIQYVLANIDEPGKLADLIVSALNINMNEKQNFLEELNINHRLKKLVKILKKELKLIELNAKIQDQVGHAINKNQREFFLREQLKAIQKELGEYNDEFEDDMSDIHEIEQKLKKIKLEPEAREAVEKEVKRLRNMHPSSPEYTVSRNYIDWMLDLPWGKFTKDNKNLTKAETILDKDHFGLKDVKERVLEFLAVKQLKEDAKSPILCFVGPPGVGKTSLGKSIARAMNRKFIRFSVGGMHDEAEIRGHRKTYIGAMPGRIIQYIKRTGVQNPVIMLDEVDKIGMDYRGDPSSALLEVLDPEQNRDFRDNYLEVSFDLSKVTFIATANTTHTIPDALYDRMET